MRRRNIVAAVVLIICGLIYGYLTSGLPTRSLPNTPDPSFFPWIVTAILLTLSVALLIQGLAVDRDQAAPASSDTAEGHRAGRLAIWALGAFIVYLAVLPELGFVLATAPFFAVQMVLFGERRPVLVVIGAVAMTALLYGLFRHGFGVFLPRGLLQGIVA